MSLYVKESKPTVLHYGFHTVDTGFQLLDFGFFVSRTWILGFQSLERFQIPLSCIPDSLSCIPDFKAQHLDSTSKNFPESKVYKPKFPGFRNPLNGAKSN